MPNGWPTRRVLDVRRNEPARLGDVLIEQFRRQEQGYQRVPLSVLLALPNALALTDSVARLVEPEPRSGLLPCLGLLFGELRQAISHFGVRAVTMSSMLIQCSILGPGSAGANAASRSTSACMRSRRRSRITNRATSTGPAWQRSLRRRRRRKCSTSDPGEETCGLYERRWNCPHPQVQYPPRMPLAYRQFISSRQAQRRITEVRWWKRAPWIPISLG